VFPSDSIVLFVDAHNTLEPDQIALAVPVIKIEVQNLSQAIAAERQLIRNQTSSDISKVKCLLAVVWGSRVAVWNCHVGDREPIKRLPAIVADVTENKAFTVVEADVKRPLLPS